MGSSFGPTKANTKGSLKTITLKVTDITNGQTVDNMRANGKITKCMGPGISFGPMEDSTTVRMLTTRNKVKASSYGLMEEVTKDNGKMENKMVEECILTSKEFRNRVLGRMARK